ncbi:hypothetical protein OIU85_009403 [Salix viminalis]|uniref:Uncharacterized protein n=1 Tax=Salix viminalis TaxID=40686 RepID=A0A9Q0NUL8_SALVM|nr:hypothetical protein OIU85_009403 [Salix viminalis]
MRNYNPKLSLVLHRDEKNIKGVLPASTFAYSQRQTKEFDAGPFEAGRSTAILGSCNGMICILKTYGRYFTLPNSSINGGKKTQGLLAPIKVAGNLMTSLKSSMHLDMIQSTMTTRF